MSAIPLRKWRRSCYGQSTSVSHGSGSMLVAAKIHRRYSSGPPVPISPLANKTLGEFVRARKLDIVLQIYPADMPLGKFCRICPNSVNIEDENIRGKVMVAIHAARAHEI